MSRIPTSDSTQRLSIWHSTAGDVEVVALAGEIDHDAQRQKVTLAKRPRNWQLALLLMLCRKVRSSKKGFGMRQNSKVTRSLAEKDSERSLVGATIEVAQQATMAAAFYSLSAGLFKQSEKVRAIGFGLISVCNAEKSIKSFTQQNYAGSALNAASSLGGAIWAAGVGMSKKPLEIAGPAVVSAAGAVEAARKFVNNEADYWRPAIESAESALFAVAYATESPYWRAGAFATIALGNAIDGFKDEKIFFGH
ncbi:hypothetical protein ACFWNK_38550 [Streptomyces sp. NPDC058417]|uniref:hypothetical protein n=1 Tax=unclassified Streptomyces TaxID=2593676 RepID=UPI003652F152